MDDETIHEGFPRKVPPVTRVEKQGIEVVVHIKPEPPEDGEPIGSTMPLDEVLRQARDGVLHGTWQQLGDDEFATRIK